MVGKILIVDDVSTNRIVFKVKLAAAGYAPLLAQDGASCIALAVRERPDMILLDLMLPDMSGIDVLAHLRADPVTRRIPVIMFSAGRDEGARLAALKAGADDFLTKPIDDQTLLARLRSFMRAGQSIDGLAWHKDRLELLGMAEAPAQFDVPGLVAIVTARPETAVLLRQALSACSSDHFTAMTEEQVFRDPRADCGEMPDVYLIEADLDHKGAGLRLMSELRSRSGSRDAAFCILNRQLQSDHAAIAFDLGANDLVDAAMQPDELALRLHTLLRRKRDEDRLRASVQDGLRLAMIDPLTGLHNRRYGVAQLAAIAERATVDGTDYAVMVADLDRFKSVNDKWGHAAGDAVLVEVARRLAANLRASDLLARIGGEEFLIALPAIALPEARVVAERLCKAIEEVPIVLSNGARLTVTISIGLAISDLALQVITADPVTQLVDRADRALL
ncbi:MAG: diguanylate cyclase, partial [Paracoccaceae bacterium]